MMFLFAAQPDCSTEPDINRLIDCYSPSLTRLCYLYLKDYQLAQEAVQDILYKAYTKYSSFSRKSSEKTWITKIAINVCKDYLRRPACRELVSSETVQLAAQREDSPYTRSSSVELLHAVYALPAVYKEVILMRYYQDLSVNEIAKILHEKPNTVSVHLKRAKELLKIGLEE